MESEHNNELGFAERHFARMEAQFSHRALLFLQTKTTAFCGPRSILFTYLIETLQLLAFSFSSRQFLDVPNLGSILQISLLPYTSSFDDAVFWITTAIVLLFVVVFCCLHWVPDIRGLSTRVTPSQRIWIRFFLKSSRNVYRAFSSFLFLPLVCELLSPWRHNSSDLPSTQALHQAFGTVTMILFSVIIIPFRLLVVNTNPLSIRDFTAGPHGRSRCFLKIAQLWLAIGFVAFPDATVHSSVFAFAVFLIACAMTFCVAFYLPFYQMFTNCVACGHTCAFLVASFLGVLAGIFFPNNLDLSISAIVLSCVLGVAGSFLPIYVQRKLEATSDNANLESPYHVEVKARLRSLRFTFGAEFEEGETEQPAIDNIFVRGAQSFPRSAYLQLARALFLFHVKGDQALGFAVLRKSEALPHSFDTHFHIQTLRNQFQSEQGQKALSRKHAAKAVEGQADLFSFIEFQRNFDAAKQLQNEAKLKLQSFWESLFLEKVPLESKESLQLLTDVEAAIKKAKNRFYALIDKYPDSPKILRSFAKFQRDILNDHSRAMKIMEQAIKADETMRKRMASEFAEEDLRPDVLDETCGIITISHRGIIQSVNRKARDMFGYKKSQLVGENLKVLMPNPYCRNHDGYLQRYMESNNPHVVGKGQRFVIGRHLKGTIVPIKLAVHRIDVGHDVLFTGILHPVPSHVSLLTVSSTNLKITGANERACKLFGHQAKHVVGKPVEKFIPNFSEKLDHLKMVGRMDSVPVMVRHFKKELFDVELAQNTEGGQEVFIVTLRWHFKQSDLDHTPQMSEVSSSNSDEDEEDDNAPATSQDTSSQRLTCQPSDRSVDIRLGNSLSDLLECSSASNLKKNLFSANVGPFSSKPESTTVTHATEAQRANNDEYTQPSTVIGVSTQIEDPTTAWTHTETVFGNAFDETTFMCTTEELLHSQHTEVTNLATPTQTMVPTAHIVELTPTGTAPPTPKTYGPATAFGKETATSILKEEPSQASVTGPTLHMPSLWETKTPEISAKIAQCLRVRNRIKKAINEHDESTSLRNLQKYLLWVFLVILLCAAATFALAIPMFDNLEKQTVCLDIMGQSIIHASSVSLHARELLTAAAQNSSDSNTITFIHDKLVAEVVSLKTLQDSFFFQGESPYPSVQQAYGDVTYSLNQFMITPRGSQLTITNANLWESISLFISSANLCAGLANDTQALLAEPSDPHCYFVVENGPRKVFDGFMDALAALLFHITVQSVGHLWSGVALLFFVPTLCVILSFGLVVLPTLKKSSGEINQMGRTFLNVSAAHVPEIKHKLVAARRLAMGLIDRIDSPPKDSKGSSTGTNGKKRTKSPKNALDFDSDSDASSSNSDQEDTQNPTFAESTHPVLHLTLAELQLEKSVPSSQNGSLAVSRVGSFRGLTPPSFGRMVQSQGLSQSMSQIDSELDEIQIRNIMTSRTLLERFSSVRMFALKISNQWTNCHREIRLTQHFCIGVIILLFLFFAFGALIVSHWSAWVLPSVTTIQGSFERNARVSQAQVFTHEAFVPRAKDNSTNPSHELLDTVHRLLKLHHDIASTKNLLTTIDQQAISFGATFSDSVVVSVEPSESSALSIHDLLQEFLDMIQAVLHGNWTPPTFSFLKYLTGIVVKLQSPFATSTSLLIARFQQNSSLFRSMTIFLAAILVLSVVTIYAFPVRGMVNRIKAEKRLYLFLLLLIPDEAIVVDPKVAKPLLTVVSQL